MEEWIKWEPLKDGTRDYIILSIFLAQGKLIVDLEPKAKNDGNSIVSFIFESSLFFSRIDDSLLLATGAKKRAEGGRWTFFKVLNSSLLKELLPTALQQQQHLTHYIFVEENSLVAVVAANEPLLQGQTP